MIHVTCASNRLHASAVAWWLRLIQRQVLVVRALADAVEKSQASSRGMLQGPATVCSSWDFYGFSMGFSTIMGLYNIIHGVPPLIIHFSVWDFP